MRNHIVIENIYDLRRREGIADMELEREILGLQVGDHVKLTFLIGDNSFAGETLLVRITRIQADSFRGKLVDSPAGVNLGSSLHAGSAIAFTHEQIHSVPKQQPKLGSDRDKRR
jgi:hypothetical protein